MGVYLNTGKIYRNWDYLGLNLTRSDQDQNIQQLRWKYCSWERAYVPKEDCAATDTWLHIQSTVIAKHL